MIESSLFLTCLKAAVHYIPNNLIMCGATLLVDVILGSLIAVARAYRVPVLSQLLDIVMALLKALPANMIMLICTLLYTMNFASVTAALHIHISIQKVNLIYLAIVALIISSVSMISEVIRSSLLSVDRGQYEAGYAAGLTEWQTFRTVIVPQAARALVPPLTNSALGVMKTTSLVSVIGVMDIINGATTAANKTYGYLEAYIAAALVFWAIGFVLERLSRLAEKYFSKSTRQLT